MIERIKDWTEWFITASFSHTWAEWQQESVVADEYRTAAYDYSLPRWAPWGDF